jgi:hypothetical protein
MAVAAEEPIQLQAHVHGVTKLEIAKDAEAFELSLISPAYNLVGFEHKPGSALQKQRVSAVLKLLLTPERFLSLNNQADCKLVSSNVETPLVDDPVKAAGPEHEEDKDEHHEQKHEEQAHEHEHHDHEGEAHRHTDIHARYHFQYAAPDRLTSLDIDLFSHFPLIEAIHAQIITPSMQREMELSPGATHIPLVL